MTPTRTLAAILTTTLAACGTSVASQPDAVMDCTTDPRVTAFAAGMHALGSQGQLTFTLAEATPAPPARDLNRWQLTLVDGAATAIVGATIKVTPYMPDHQHSSGVVPVVTEPSPGHYQLDMINLWMPGVWQTTIEATPVGGAKDVAVFGFCIAS
jgi:hypothetical protein